MTIETIFALSSGFGRAGIAVLRLSGPAVRTVLLGMIGRVPEPRRATLARFKDPASGEVLDQGLALFFPGPASETGEDCAEFHCHGGPAIVAAMLRAFAGFAATRLAEPGEFVRRAFENGKLDLTEVEGLADLVEAETQAQRRQALRQMQGELSRKADAWRNDLLAASALIEAEIDFGDEADVSSLARQQILEIIGALIAQLRDVLAAGSAGERLREGLTIVIAGPPNAGKSTLLNALARRDVAIVSAIPGTTRDAIEVHLDLSGLPLTLIDTAGLRDSEDPIETIGIARTRAKAAAADLILWLSEVGAPEAPVGFEEGAKVWPIFTKTDVGQRLPDASGAAIHDGVAISAATGENMELLLARLTEFAKKATGGGEGALITRERHRCAMIAALAALERAHDAHLGAPELLAEDLRGAIRALESLIGKIDVEEILGEIFSRFCIGK
ncbi:tRNA uridine-5-carboxymethylaminomethyl(34) synthesis GTPase MnmE [Methylovirgula sp. HY1]|uniref:tRNA uridine-5-carboxymethylaminomethyl(34) synthesis GTPase MnmE n=1 Tax=Methylovirgula sp. HY1 TaxID=2822761 RepID=UPI001C5B7AFA|nr:tRNA uridine-5-carboxymethylaminomethyl(34) synthesis GTPase MnmE [Methylovirgula sp. HY1]QXX75483.1 tRNA modification GTPase MnmE [Methylovirgula sp. HY1]